MKNRKYEQPKLELVAVAANDVLLASGGDAGLDLVSQGKITDNGDVVFLAASGGLDIFK